MMRAVRRWVFPGESAKGGSTGVNSSLESTKGNHKQTDAVSIEMNPGLYTTGGGKGMQGIYTYGNVGPTSVVGGGGPTGTTRVVSFGKRAGTLGPQACNGRPLPRPSRALLGDAG